jgi:prepilin-type N-terminal cleavage/methylation domain-containing protein
MIPQFPPLEASMYRKQQGFTLIEIAIVLVIIGLLLGGILKGQELITNARVRNLIAQQDGIKAAFFGFQDRFRALPGDYNQATVNITGISTAACNGGNGDGNGQITTTNDEMILAWEHLSKAGFITGSYTCAATESNTTSPTNPYSMFLRIIYDNAYADTGTAPTRHNLKSGNQIPSDIIAEVDRKVDDGNATTGALRFSAFSSTGTAPTAANCYDATSGLWIAANCGAASLF